MLVFQTQNQYKETTQKCGGGGKGCNFKMKKKSISCFSMASWDNKIHKFKAVKLNCIRKFL